MNSQSGRVREARSGRRNHEPALPAIFEFARARGNRRGGGRRELHGVGGLRGILVALYDGSWGAAPAAGAILTPASRQRTGPRLPLLPHLGRDLEFRRDSPHRDLHDVPLSSLARCADAGTGSSQLAHRHAFAVDAGERFAGLRLLRSQHPRAKGNRLRELPRRRGSNAAHGKRRVALHAMVSRLPSPPGETNSSR